MIFGNSRAYDASAEGIFSAARFWWMMKYFGHKQVSVLDGGILGVGLAIRPVFFVWDSACAPVVPWCRAFMSCAASPMRCDFDVMATPLPVRAEQVGRREPGARGGLATTDADRHHGLHRHDP